MNKELRINETEEQKVYFTSDLHAFHKQPFIWEARGHKSIEEHTQFIINKINEIVGVDDYLFNLGDITLNCSEDTFEGFLSQIKCQNIYTIWGNHNSPSHALYQREVSKIFGEDVEVYPFRYKNIIFLGNYAEIIVQGQKIILSHYPLISWNDMKKGSWLLYGHIHNRLKLDGKRIDTGWDNFKKPVSFQELQKIMSHHPIISDGAHH